MTSSASLRTADELAALLNVELEKMRRWSPTKSVPYTTLLENMAHILQHDTGLVEGTRYLSLETTVRDKYANQIQLGGEHIVRPSHYIGHITERTVPKKEDGTIPFSFCLPRTVRERVDRREMYGLYFLVVGNKDAIPVSLGCILDLGLRRQYRTFLYVHEIHKFSFVPADTGSTPLVNL